MDKPTFVSWLWHGWRPVYDYRHVNRLKRMLEAKMSIPFRMVCLTDDSRGIECETRPLWAVPRVNLPDRKPNCFVRLPLFAPRVAEEFGDLIVSIDLDCAILQDLAPLLTEEKFKAARGYRSHLCGSMWQLRAGHPHADVLWDFDPVESVRLIASKTHVHPIRGSTHKLSGSDQAWMSIKIPNAPLWTEDDGVYQYLEMKPQQKRNPPKNARVVFFAGSAKPWDRMVQMERSPLYDPLPQL